MGWLDDLQARASASIDNIENSAFTYFDDLTSDPAVLVGQANRGNQTAADIQKGNFGGPVPIAGAKAPAAATANAAQASMLKLPANLNAMLPLLIAGAVLAFVLLKRKG